MRSQAQHIMSHRLNVRTMTDSGFLYHAMQPREARELKLQLRHDRNAKIKAFLFGGTKGKCRKFVGKCLAKLTYSLWKSGFFASFEEFNSPHPHHSA